MNAITAASVQPHPTTGGQPRLVQAAHEFEAQMMKELLKPIGAGSGLGGDDSDSGSGGALADFATEALGRSLSNHGGLGIATKILRDLSRSETNSAGSSDPGESGAGCASLDH